ncbi:uncharacterized protein F4822DRAFT_398440 [Hypoxylon trugodes]|uniref:uncharacterized protein n=1 Tax=Hypoxylon trugodes TaxID=326681 RepID=UPI0021988269|nr:uncharacterized protein F4822DRAFT_398440 [Hypoxylon trugodes]KAI1389463.1 hypothetical protein F4822DRAFT_398440 [Hypoxylon trugodes]
MPSIPKVPEISDPVPEPPPISSGERPTGQGPDPGQEQGPSSQFGDTKPDPTEPDTSNPDPTSPSEPKNTKDVDWGDLADQASNLDGNNGDTSSGNGNTGSGTGQQPPRIGTGTGPPIAAATSEPTPTTPPSPPPQGLPPWGIPVIVVASVIGALLLAGLALFFMRRRKQKKLRKEEIAEDERERDTVYHAQVAAYRKLEQMESSRAEDSDTEGRGGMYEEGIGSIRGGGRGVNGDGVSIEMPVRTHTFESGNVSVNSLAPATTQLARSSSVVSSLTSSSRGTQGQGRYERIDAPPSPLSDRSPETDAPPYMWTPQNLSRAGTGDTGRGLRVESNIPSILRPGSTRPGTQGGGG